MSQQSHEFEIPATPLLPVEQGSDVSNEIAANTLSGVNHDTLQQMIGSEVVAETRFSRVRAFIGDTHAGRTAVAGTLLLSGIGGGAAALILGGEAAAAPDASRAPAASAGRFQENCTPLAEVIVTSTPTPTPTPTDIPSPTESPSPTETPTETVTLPPTIVANNDCFNVYAGIGNFSLNPMGNDVINTDYDNLTICDIVPGSPGVKLTEDVFPRLVSVTATKAARGIYHNSVTICNSDDGSRDTFDLAVNVIPALAPVIKQKVKPHKPYDIVQFKNPNGDVMYVNTTTGFHEVKPFGTVRVKSGKMLKYLATLNSDQHVFAGKGKIKFPKKQS